MTLDFLLIGIFGVYTRIIYREAKGHPLYVVEVIKITSN